MTKGENVMKELRKVFCVFAVFVLMLSLGIVGHAETGFNQDVYKRQSDDLL